jgi:two-component system chemotaxis sensor kinase CheA
MEHYIDLFVNELSEYVKQLNDHLLRLEKNSKDRKSIVELFRIFHTIKGMSQTMGYTTLAEISHTAESLLEDAKERGAMQGHVVDVLFAVTEIFERSATALRSGETLPPAQDVLTVLDQLKEGKIPSYEPQAETRRGIGDIHIKLTKLDRLFNLTNELTIMRSRINKISQVVGDPHLQSLSDTAARLISELQDEVVRLRMLPLSTVFDLFPRWFRDEAKRQKKDAELKISGAEIEVDRSVIETLREPLLHLVRNALDHGIDTQPKEARKKGIVTLAAVREKDRIHISVRDNGRGLDPELIRRTAVRRKIVTEKESHRLTQESLLRLIVRPDFSTRETVTTLSGRGIGLDIVQSAVVRLGGRLHISSEKNDFTCFTLEVPVTLATVRAMIVRLNGQRFALPLSYIQETLYVSEESLRSVFHRELFPLREELIPVVRLSERLGCLQSEGRKSLIIVQYGGKKRGFLADSIVDEDEIVVKNTGSLFANPAYSGCSIYADGLPILILDPRGLE